MNGNWHELKKILHNESELKKIHCAKPAENRMRPPNSSTDSSELDTWQSWASWRTAAEAVGGRRPDVGRRRMVGGRHGPPHGPEEQEPAETGDSGRHRHRDDSPRPAGHSAE